MTEFTLPNVLWCVPGQDKNPVLSTLSWYTTDPFAFHVTFEDATGTVSWVVSRDVVNEALETGAAGNGDVRITVGDGKLTMRLSSYAEITLETPAEPVARFLRRTYKTVPQGQEDHTDVIDAAVRKILDET